MKKEFKNKKKYQKPNIYELGDIAALTAGSGSGGSETSRNCVNNNNYWANSSPGSKPA